MSDMQVEASRLVALGQFIEYLSAGPELGDGVVRALVRGALSPVGARGGNIYLSDGAGSLVLVGYDGFTEEEVADYRVISTSLPFPITKAFVTRQSVMTPWMTAEEEYPLLSPERSASATAVAQRRTPEGCLVALPMLWQGVCVGVTGAVLAEQEWADESVGRYVEAVVGALGLWLAGRSPGRPALATPRSSRTGRQLTPRQLEILRLIAAGKSNGSIAACLGYSVSTVKSDVAGILDTLGVPDRTAAVSAAADLGLIEA